MTGTIILNQNNLSPDGSFNALITQGPYNSFSQNLRSISLVGKQIGLRKLTMVYSWSNIMNASSISVAYPLDAVSYTTLTWTLPAQTNYKTIAELNEAFQSFCITSGLYLINGTNNVYFAEFRENTTTFKVELNLYLLPTSLPVGYTAPGTWVGYPTTSKTLKITIGADNEIGNIIGFPAGTYNGNLVATQFVSTMVPMISPVACVYMTCNIAKNDVPLNGSNVMEVFTTHNVEYGATIEVFPSQIQWYDIDLNSNNLEIRFFDQNFNLLKVQDPSTTIQLSIK